MTIKDPNLKEPGPEAHFKLRRAQRLREFVAAVGETFGVRTLGAGEKRHGLTFVRRHALHNLAVRHVSALPDPRIEYVVAVYRPLETGGSIRDRPRAPVADKKPVLPDPARLFAHEHGTRRRRQSTTRNQREHQPRHFHFPFSVNSNPPRHPRVPLDDREKSSDI